MVHSITESEKTKPIRVKPTTGSVKSSHAGCRGNVEDSGRTWFRTNRNEPGRELLLTNKKLPKRVWSGIDTTKSRLEVERTGSESPILARLCEGIENSKCKRSGTEMAESAHDMPRKKSEKPRCKGSSADKHEPV